VALGFAPAPPAWRHQPARRLRWPLLVGGGLLVLAALFATAVLEWSGATLSGDPSALARVEIQPFGGVLQKATAADSEGRAIALANRGGRLTPAKPIAPGTRVTIDVLTRRPGWNAWLVGKTSRRRLQVTAPFAKVTSAWVTKPAGDPVPVTFSEPIARVAYAGRTARGTGRSLAIPARPRAGTVRVAVAARPWERVGPPVTVHYFPPAKRPVALVSPAPGGKLDPGAQLRLTLSAPVKQVLGDSFPKLSPSVPGHWKRSNDHALVFTPSGTGPALGSHVKLTLAHSVAATDALGRNPKITRELTWTVPQASPLRLIQLLADGRYLPLEFKPSGAAVERTARAEATAATDPPAGTFEWRYGNTPKELTRQWKPEVGNVIVRGALMMFQDGHKLTVDGLPGPDVWKALLHDALAGKRRDGGYSYVYVHRDDRPQRMTLWHSGRTIFTSPGNTGVPAAPTELGTFPVFEHLAETTMSGTNPDGSHYTDPGIKWVSYFNGGDALHAFDRASFGTPQSVGCVELPLASAAKLWPYTPIGTLVTIEH
jgi:hypothetical protein